MYGPGDEAYTLPTFRSTEGNTWNYYEEGDPGVLSRNGGCIKEANYGFIRQTQSRVSHHYYCTLSLGQGTSISQTVQRSMFTLVLLQKPSTAKIIHLFITRTVLPEE